MTEPIKEKVKLAASIAEEDEEKALAVANHNQANYKRHWVVNSRCANHMTGDKEKLQNVSKYKGGRWREKVVIVDNTRLPIAHIGVKR